MANAYGQSSGNGPDPRQQDCEWCRDGTKAVKGIPMLGAKKVRLPRWVFACQRHLDVAYRSTGHK